MSKEFRVENSSNPKVYSNNWINCDNHLVIAIAIIESCENILNPTTYPSLAFIETLLGITALLVPESVLFWTVKYMKVTTKELLFVCNHHLVIY